MARKSFLLRTAVGLATLFVVLLVVVWVVRRHRITDIAGVEVAHSLLVTSASFTSGSNLLPKSTCDGAGESPAISLPTAPYGTKSFALIVEDLDAPIGFVHWVVYDIPPNTHEIAEGASAMGKLPGGATEGTNSVGSLGYVAPCPPGSSAHRYVFRLYALSVGADLAKGMTKQQLRKAVTGQVLAEGEMIGLYGRVRR